MVEPRGCKIVNSKEESYVKKCIVSSEVLSKEDILRQGKEINFIGTYVGDLKHYNEKEWNMKN